MTTSYPAESPEPHTGSACPPLVRSTGPTDSVVVMCLSGPRRRIGPVIRVDLEAGQVPAGTAAQLAVHAHRHADAVVVMTFTDPEVAAAPDTAALVSVLREGCKVLDVIDASNSPHRVPDVLMAATVFNGRAVLPDRAALARSVEHHPAAAPVPAAIAQAMGSKAGRDQYLITRRGDPAAVSELLAAAQGAADRHTFTPNVCAALAVLAYRNGDGALAQVAVDRTVRLDPTHQLAQLMLAVMAAGLPPADLDDLLTP
jgi:hypothetical protein